MKIFKILMLSLFISTVMNAQEVVKTEVPTSFTEGLLKAYPNATAIKWQRNNNDYKVEFEVGDLQRTVHFNKDGEQIRIEAEMVTTSLPKVLSDAINKDYSDFNMESVYSITKHGITTYKVTLQRRDWLEEIILRYSEEGEKLGENKY